MDMERLALELMMHEVSCLLPTNKKLPYIKSMKNKVLKSRSYTPYQAFRVCSAQKEANAFSTKLAFFAGLRSHELLTILPFSEQHPSNRPAHELKFLMRETWMPYTVTGKGGLIREVRLPPSLSKRLETKRLAEPRKVVDRRVNYTQHYDLKGGVNFSSSFSSASQRALGWSNGAHGARHSYAQLRMTDLRSNGVDRNTALRVVSQELGHFRPSITLVYLR
ncbi:MAG: site-specific integrase [Ghiorsea sp.]|nr:site-specific integrase [Ghiorsea sp.]